VVDVSENGDSELELRKNHTNTIQISVHGGANPWHYYLGEDNGCPVLNHAERIAS
jgi:hypothetical protein